MVAVIVIKQPEDVKVCANGTIATIEPGHQIVQLDLAEQKTEALLIINRRKTVRLESAAPVWEEALVCESNQKRANIAYYPAALRVCSVLRTFLGEIWCIIV